MRTVSEPVQPVARVTNRNDAERLVDGVLAAMSELHALLDSETAQVRAGKLREGLAQEARKAELASSYLRGLEAVKANAVALARCAPDPVVRLKEAHRRFAQAIEANQTVLATARAVSEGLLKSIADELDTGTRPQGYAPAGLQRPRPQAGAPLVLSRNL